MSSDDPQDKPCCYLPAILFVAAFNLLLLFELHAQWRQVSALRKASQTLTQQVDRARSDKELLRNTQAALSSLAGSLLTLANNDAEVRRIVEKHQIRRNPTPASPSSTPSPAPATVPPGSRPGTR